MLLRKTFFGAMIALLLLVPLTPRASAQDSNRLTSLQISVWPEYDTKTVLVLVDGTLADKSNLPREVAVLIPSAAQLIVTTWENPDGSLAVEQPNKSTDAGDGYTRVTFSTSQPNFHIEYYHDLLRGSPDKTMDFAYKSNAIADQVTLEVQQPLKATNFAVTPATTNTRSETSGFKYFIYQFANVTVGQILTAQAKYTKTDPNPSVQAPAAPQAQPTTTTPTADSNNNWILLIGMVTLGSVAVLGFLYYQQRARQAEPVTERMSPKQFQRNRRRARGTLTEAGVFCTQCGHALGPDDNFCPKCGTKRRS